MPRTVRLALALSLCMPLAVAEGASKEVQKLEKQLLKDKDSSVRARAARDLGKMGSTESVPALTQAMSDSSAAVRANAAASLWKLGAASKPAIPALRAALDDTSAAVVGNAGGALRKLGVPKAELLPAYRRLLTRRDCESRVIGVKRLVNEVPPLELFDHAWECGEAPGDDFDLKRDAREAFRKIVDRRDRVLVPRMLETLKTIGMRDGSDIIYPLSRIEPPVKEAVPVFVELLDARNEQTQKSAIIALGRMGAPALPALPRLVECLQSKREAALRERAAEAIGNLGPKAASAVPALIKAASDDKWPRVREESLSALGRMGPAAREGIPVLRAALEDPDGGISIAARNALFRVEPNKKAEVADIADKARPVQKGSLYADTSQLAATLSGRIPEAFALNIYDDFAMVTAPYADSRNGRGEFTYKAGTVTGPDDARGSDDCKKTIALAKVDFTLVPKLVKRAPGLLGSPSGKVDLVSLSGGVFCKSIGWIVHVKDAGMVEFKIDGKVDKVRKM